MATKSNTALLSSVFLPLPPTFSNTPPVTIGREKEMKMEEKDMSGQGGKPTTGKTPQPRAMVSPTQYCHSIKYGIDH